MSESMPIIELPDIIQQLQNKRWTGTLEVVGGEDRKSYLFFREGVIQHSKMDRSEVILGRACYELGLIDEADYVMTLADCESTGRRFGEVLVELGLVAEDGIRAALVHQAREDILNTLTWKNLDVRFHAGSPPLPEVFGAEDVEVDLGISGMGLLMEAARREDEWGIVRQHIPSEHDVLAPSNGRLEEGVAHRRVALLIDAHRSAYEIAEEAPLARLECLKALAELVRDGHLRCLEPADLVKVGAEAEADEDYAKALRVYELTLERGVDHLDLFRRAARTCHLLGRQKEALRRWVDVAERCVAADRRDLAISALREAAAIDPSDIELRHRLVHLLVEAQEQGEAAQQLRDLIALAQEDGADPALTQELLTQLLTLAPEDEPTLRGLAELHLSQDERVHAMSRYDELAAVLCAKGSLEEAVAVYYTILDIDEENLQARLSLAETLAKMGSADDAVREYRRLADVLYQSGLIANSINWPFLIKVYESIVELEPQSTPAWEWLAKAYIENGQDDLAISRYLGMAESLEPPAGMPPPAEILLPFERILELDPTRLDLRRRLARTHVARDEPDKAVRAFRRLAEAALAVDKAEEAKGAYFDALEVNPFDPDSRRGLAAIHETQGDADEAHAQWRAVGGMCLRAGLLEQASRDFLRALKLKRDDAETLLECARSEEGREQAQSAATIYARYAELMLGRGNLGLAREALDKAGGLNPALPMVKDLRQRLEAAGQAV